MVFNNPDSYVLRNAKDEFYRFYISSQGNLIAELYIHNSHIHSIEIAVDILLFSINMDKDGKIHILYLSREGNLHHEIHNIDGSSRILTHLDLNSNNIMFLNMKAVGRKLHVFYMQNQKNTRQWTICHLLFQEERWISHKAATVFSEKYVYPYSVDYYNDNLYLFYSNDSNCSYSIKKFNQAAYSWDMLDENITIPGSYNASFLVNHNNIAFICYTSAINKDICTMVKYRELDNKCSSWSKASSLSCHSINAIHPSLAVKDAYTYVLWEEGSNIVYKRTASNKIDWDEKLLLSPKSSRILSGIYISSHPEDCSFKSSLTPILLNEAPCPLINLEKITIKTDSIEKIIAVDRNLSAGTVEMISRDEYIAQLQMTIEEKDGKIHELEQSKNELTAETANLKLIIKNKNDELDGLKHDLKALEKDSVSSKELLEIKIRSLSEGMSSSDTDSLKRLEDELIEKKDIIERLNILVNALYQDNNSKEYEIQQLEERLNKGLLHKIFR